MPLAELFPNGLNTRWVVIVADGEYVRNTHGILRELVINRCQRMSQQFLVNEAFLLRAVFRGQESVELGSEALQRNIQFAFTKVTGAPVHPWLLLL